MKIVMSGVTVNTHFSTNCKDGAGSAKSCMVSNQGAGGGGRTRSKFT